MDEQESWEDSNFDADAFLEEFLSSLAIPDHQDDHQTGATEEQHDEG